MDHHEHAHPSVSGGLTLTHVMSRIEGHPDLAPSRRQEMVSALRTVARALGSEPASIPADLSVLRKRLAGVSAMSAGVSRGRWNNVRSLTMAALKSAGVRIMPKRRGGATAMAWKELEATLPNCAARCSLSRFITFCCGEGIEPGSVDGAVFERFRETLSAQTLARRPVTAYRNACNAWNDAANTIATWPKVQIPVPNLSRRFALSWDAFPASFRISADEYLHRIGHRDPFSDDYAGSAKASTVELRRKQLLQIATALVRSGVPAEQIVDLAVLVTPDNTRRALRYLYDRAGGQSTASIHERAILLHTIAKNGVKVGEAQLRPLAELMRGLAVKKKGMTDKNRARLRQFDDKIVVQALLTLPYRVLREVERADMGRRRDALRVMAALAVELLIVAPVRVKNLTSLEIDRHIVRTRLGADTPVHLVIPAEEVKNDAPCEMVLPPETVQLLDHYLLTYRPRLADVPSPWLFPNDQGGRRVITRLSTGIKEFLQAEVGIEMNVHLFRHFAMKLHFAKHPDDLETARRLLGHKSLATTLRFYTELKSPAAFERYDATIAGLRQAALARLGVSSGRGAAS